MENNQEYAAHVVECHGMLWNQTGHFTAMTA